MPDADQPHPAWWNRRRAMTAVAGLAAVLGVGAFVITDRLTDDSPARDVAVLSAPSPEPVTGSPEPPPPAEPSATALETASPPATPKASATRQAEPDAAVSREIVIARSKAAADGVRLQRPLTGKAMTAAADVRVTTSGSPRDPGGTLKVVTAHGDLTGYEELGWVGDDGEPVGDAHCTQRFRLSNDVKPSKRSTLLVCWRTSAEKSVYTVALSLLSPPSKTASVAALDQAWTTLG